jgi:hypothetical protein
MGRAFDVVRKKSLIADIDKKPPSLAFLIKKHLFLNVIDKSIQIMAG